jgi:hypothetical protein
VLRIRCDGPPSLAKEKEEEEAAAEADEDEEDPAKREAAKQARREARRARRKAKLRRYMAGDWAYVPTYTYCIYWYVALAFIVSPTAGGSLVRLAREPDGVWAAVCPLAHRMCAPA